MRRKESGIRIQFDEVGREVDLTFHWTVSRGRDTYGYNICTLYADGVKVAACNGGGYDMQGTALGDFVASAFADRLRARIGKEAGKCERCGGTGKIKPGNIIVGDALEGAPWDRCNECRGSGLGGGYYGLTFHDPDYDPGTAPSPDNPEMSVAEAEAAGLSLGLERYQAFYGAAAPLPDEKHRIPSIHYGIGMGAVQSIMKGIGLELHYRDIKLRGGDSAYTLVVGQ